MQLALGESNVRAKRRIVSRGYPLKKCLVQANTTFGSAASAEVFCGVFRVFGFSFVHFL